MKAYQKGRVVWRTPNHSWTRGSQARVWLNNEGAASYEYKVDTTDPEFTCCFTLFCEVGAPYQPLFARFFEKFKVVGKVNYGNARPYIADKVEKIYHGKNTPKAT